MTYSVVALSRDGARLGVATASRSLAVGAAVPALAPRVGALVTQAYTNQRFRALGLQLLRDGLEPSEVIERLARADDDFTRRQVGLVDVRGRTAAWTGPDCTSWAGEIQGERYVVLGNYLVGPETVDAMHRLMRAEGNESFPERLLTALEAAQGAGGDARGQQSAALRVVNNAFEDVSPSLTEVDLRVDDDPDPLRLLRAMLEGLATAADDAAEELTDPARPGPTMA